MLASISIHYFSPLASSAIHDSMLSAALTPSSRERFFLNLHYFFLFYGTKIYLQQRILKSSSIKFLQYYIQVENLDTEALIASSITSRPISAGVAVQHRFYRNETITSLLAHARESPTIGMIKLQPSLSLSPYMSYQVNYGREAQSAFQRSSG